MLTISKYIIILYYIILYYIILYYIILYNIASRAAQSNSVYVNVLKVPIVVADGVSKWLCEYFVFRASGPCKRGEKYYISLQ